MALTKYGSDVKINVVKQGNFGIDVNMLATLLQKQWPSKKITLEQIHSALKSLGVVNYQSDDMADLSSRLQSIGFTVVR